MSMLIQPLFNEVFLLNSMMACLTLALLDYSSLFHRFHLSAICVDIDSDGQELVCSFRQTGLISRFIVVIYDETKILEV